MGVNSGWGFILVHYDTLLWNTKDIITAILLQNATKKILQNASGFLL